MLLIHHVLAIILYLSPENLIEELILGSEKTESYVVVGLINTKCWKLHLQLCGHGFAQTKPQLRFKYCSWFDCEDGP